MNEQTVAALTAAFGRMPLRVMTADMLYDSLKQAYGDPKLDLRAVDAKDSIANGMSAPSPMPTSNSSAASAPTRKTPPISRTASRRC